MNAKILKYELFTLFSLTVVTLVVFYYRDTLPDNYLSISSASSHGFFAYYGTSLLNFINYYSGPWVLIPCALFTSFYVFIFSKRADWIDALNILSLAIFSLWTVYYLQPSLLGAGLFQILTSAFSPFASLLLLVGSLVCFTWGTFRGDFTEKVKMIYAELKELDLVTPTEKLRAFSSKHFNAIKGKFSPKSKYKEIEQTEQEVPPVTPSPKKEESSVIHLEPMREIVQKIVNIEVMSDEEQLPVIIASDDEEEDVEFVNNDDGEYVDESEIGLSLKGSKAADKFNEDKYYDLVKLASQKKGDQKFSQPDDKYFHDIITKIQVKLGEFRIAGRIINVLKGPVVDTFEWELGAGEKVSRLTVTAEDLSLALSGSPIRMVYPMKGRTTVGIEVPRNPREFIFLDDVISCKDYTNTAHQLPLAMGKDAFGEPVVVDLAAMPHMLVAGSTGAGKSVFINSILVSLLIKRSPNQMKLILIDPKQLELALYARLPHLLMPVITEAKTAATALLWACQEMERRYSIMSEFGVRNIEGFNHKLKRAPRETVDKIRKFYEYSSEDTYELPYIVVIVDEFADLILTQKGKEIETHICRLAAKARAAGVHLILATQRPSVDVITGLIKSNFPTRVSFRVTSSTDSRTILNAMGAEKLLGKGDMLYKQGVDTTRIHSAYVEEDEIESLTEKLAEMAPSFDPNIMEFLETGGEEEPEVNVAARDGGDIGERDDKYDEAVRVVIEHRSASASLLQRRLGVGYNRAANLIEEMESKGVVGPAQGSKPRKVLMGAESLT
ncbi:MAG: DNA translocase FtsK [Bacteriovorax sp.]|jgi:S-DNA-T family DNA segregation ATPase FtsK/SpoIIIE